jgi:glycine oxidase
MLASSGSQVDVAVIGGGIVGLAVAWHARERGLSVVVLERDRIGCGASHVAAGMLAPVAEVEFGEHGRRVLELGLRSAAMWPRFAEELERASGMDLGVRRIGTLMVAHDDDEARELERQWEFRRSLGLRAIRLRASEAREREPALAPVVRLALEVPDDHSLDPRLAVAALRAVCERAGVEIRERTPVAGLVVEGERAIGVMLGSPVDDSDGGSPVDDSGSSAVGGAGGTEVVEGGGDGGRPLLYARQMVVAAGSWSGVLGGLPVHARVPVRPVKGQIMLLRDPSGPGLLSRAVRYGGGYLVPRGDGRCVLGGTVEERGFDPQPTAGAVYELLRHAHEVVPGVSELELIELNVGYRPGTPDNAPIIGRGALDGLIWATGHYRNGILLAPLTAELVVGLLAEETADQGVAAVGDVRADVSGGGRGPEGARESLLATCDPARFATTTAHVAAEGALS